MKLSEQIQSLEYELRLELDELDDDQMEKEFGVIIDNYVKENEYINRINLAYKIEIKGIDYFINGYSSFPTCDLIYYKIAYWLIGMINGYEQKEFTYLTPVDGKPGYLPNL